MSTATSYARLVHLLQQLDYVLKARQCGPLVGVSSVLPASTDALHVAVIDVLGQLECPREYPPAA